MGPLRDRTVQRVSLPESGFGFEVWTGFRHADEFHVGLETDRVGNAFADGSVSVHPQAYLDLRSIGQTHTISVNYGWEIDHTASNLLGDRLGWSVDPDVWFSAGRTRTADCLAVGNY